MFVPGTSGCLKHTTVLTQALEDARRSHECQMLVAWLDFENAFGLVTMTFYNVLEPHLWS